MMARIRRRRAGVRRVADAPTASQRLRLAVCLVLIALPHVFHLPLWVLALTVPIVTWQGLAAWRNWPQPGRLVRFLLAAAVFVTVFAAFGRVNGQEAGVSLLLLMLALKLCEIRSHRDAMVFLSLLCFLLITQFLFSQSLAMAAYLILGTWLVVAAFVDIGSRTTTGIALSDSARLLLQALPIAALLFVLFPRIPGPIWGLPSDAGARAVSGLSDSMSPGSITNLALSEGVALRARFIDGVPPPAQRYWRGPVLWDFNGESWEVNQANRRLPEATVDAGPDSRRWRVDITLEPTRQDWLIALDVPQSVDRESRRGAGATLSSDDDIDTRTRYVATSLSGARLDSRLPATSRRRALLLPVDGNPRARALARHWVDQGLAPPAIVAAALRRFREQPFVYTLSPERTRRNARIDDFLFRTRQGFCEHYAGAFTFLMRAAGVPARVVTGYQGGEAALVGDYWVVRNSDAHAWAEVWLDGQGWTRVDPTAAVAPERIESGVSASLADNSALPYMARAGGQAWYRLQMLWDGVNAGWNRWFLAYGPQLQQQVLDALGLAGWTRALLALTAAMIAMLALVSLWLAWQMRRRAHPDPVVRAWATVCARLAAAGHPRAVQEGPRAFGERVAASRPDLAVAVRALAQRYVRLRYAPLAGDEKQQAERDIFIRHARDFRPSRQRRARGATTASTRD
ncbi:transglutaminase TgpA family protein [Salinisphaera aquimarina]|uniref:DUF3488 and DUF4129 domain-containing transglutaminase family protein n=1 Tax=Salinisphaera aquimarina TaxID=2094031 RepID=A0ABV7ERG1_9GAMM